MYFHSTIEDPSLLAADAEETAYETLAAEYGWDAIERGENPDRFVSENEMSGADIANLEWEMACMAEYEAARYETFC